MTNTGFYGWKLLAAFWVILFINLAFPMYGASVINPYMAESLKLDRKMLGLTYTVYMIMSGLPGPLVAVCVNRWGIRATLVAGSLIVVSGALAMALLVNSGLMAVVIFGLIIGTGVVTGGALPAQAGVAMWFVRKRALALSILLSAAAIGGFVATPLLDRIISSAGGNWRLGWWLIAGLGCISTVVAALFVKNHPADLGQAADGLAPRAGSDISGAHRAPGGSVYTTRVDWTFGETLRAPSFWLIMLCAVGFSGSFTLFMAHGVVHLKDLGHSSATAAHSISILIISTLIGKIIFGTLGDRIEPRYIWSFFMASFGTGMLIVINATNTLDLYLYAVCVGIGFGGSMVCMMTILSNYYGSRAYAAAVGLAMAVQTTASAIAPFVAGYYYDLYGSYSWTFIALAAWCFAGGLILIFIQPPVKGEPMGKLKTSYPEG